MTCENTYSFCSFGDRRHSKFFECIDAFCSSVAMVRFNKCMATAAAAIDVRLCVIKSCGKTANEKNPSKISRTKIGKKSIGNFIRKLKHNDRSICSIESHAAIPLTYSNTAYVTLLKHATTLYFGYGVIEFRSENSFFANFCSRCITDENHSTCFFHSDVVHVESRKKCYVPCIVEQDRHD